MPNRAETEEVARNRVFPYIATDVLSWLQNCYRPGGPFASDGHAIEVALQRLFEEQQFVRAECKRTGTRFNAASFWSLYAVFVEESRPNTAGRPSKGQVRSVVERRQVAGGVDVRLLKWVDATLQQGHFESPSHIIETGLRYLRSLDTDQRWAGQGFPVDASARWASYQRAAG